MNSFSEMLEELRHWPRVGVLELRARRRGWDHCAWLAVQWPDDHSKMGAPYLYLRTCNERTGEPLMLPWLPANMDLFTNDWSVDEVRS